MSKRAETVVVGLGNELMRDEGVGVRIVRALASAKGVPRGVEVVEAGNSLLGALRVIAGRRSAILLDCALMDEPPGAFKRFVPADVRSRKNLPGFSLHEGDLMGGLRLSRELGELPDQVVIFGIQPSDVRPGLALSPILEARLPDYAAAVLRELKAERRRAGA